MGVLSKIKSIAKTAAKKITGGTSSGGNVLSTNISNQSKYVAPPTYSKQKASVNKIVDVVGQLQKDVENAKMGVGQSSATNLKRPAPLKPYDIPTVPDGPMSRLPIGSTTTTTKSKSSSSGSSSKSTLQSVQNLAASDSAMSFSAPASYSTSSSSSGGSSSSSSSSGSKSGSASTGGGGAGGVNSGSTPAQQLEAARQQLVKMAEKLSAQEKTAATDAIVSDSEITKEEEAAQKALKDAQKVDDSSLKLLKAEMRQAKADALAEMESINGAYNTQKTGMEGQQLNETGQTAVGIANAGGFLGFSGSGTGVMLKLAESHRAELASLESQRQNALTTARKAAAERRFDIVQEQVSEIARIDNEKYNRVQEYNKKVIENAEKEKAKAETLANQESIHNAIAAGATTPDEIFEKIGGTVPIKDIYDYLSVSNKKNVSGKLFSFNPTQTAKLLGAGMNTEEVQALAETISEVGYTEQVRMALPAAVRAVADSIYLAKSGGGGGSGALNSADAMDQTFNLVVGNSGSVAAQERNIALYNNYIANGQTEAASKLVDSLAVKGMTAAQKTTFGKMGTIVRVREKLGALEDNFAKTNPNMYTTMLQKGAGYVAMSKDPVWLSFVASSQGIINDYRNSIFGASLTGNELAAANLSLPDYTKDTLGDISTKLDALSSYAHSTRDALLQDSAGNYGDVSLYGQTNGQGIVGGTSTPAQTETLPGEDIFTATVGTDAGKDGYWSNLGGESVDFIKSIFGY